jgi:hypothetical protein
MLAVEASRMKQQTYIDGGGGGHDALPIRLRV